jgi:hypothetical protein
VGSRVGNPVVVRGRKNVEEGGRKREYLYPVARTPAKGKGKEHPLENPGGMIDSLGLITSLRGFGKGERKRISVLGRRKGRQVNEAEETSMFSKARVFVLLMV